MTAHTEEIDPTAAETLAQLYDFVASVLADPPEAEWVRNICEDSLPSSHLAPNDRLEAGFENLEKWAESVDDPVTESEHLETEFTRLFVGPRPKLQIHESWYAGDFLGEPLAAVSRTYEDLGIEPAPDLKEEADHAAVELAALRELSRREVDDPGGKDTFLEKHGAWFDDLADDIRDEADGRFYPAIADIVAGLVAFDADRRGVE